MASFDPRDRGITIMRRKGFSLMEHTAGTTAGAVKESYYTIVDSRDKSIVFARFYESPVKKHKAAIAEFENFLKSRA
jgi:hypothetical protein